MMKPPFEHSLNRSGVIVRFTGEATGNWYWLVDLLQGLDIEVSLANPLQIKAIAYARVKTDKVDAKTLTHLLRTDFLPTCYLPKPEQRANRDLLRIRAGLVVRRTQFKNIIHGVLEKFNINLPYSNIWGGVGHEALDKVSLPLPYSEFIKQILVHIDHLNSQISYWDKKIQAQIPLCIDAQRLLTVPGIGNIWALTIIYESGPITRFLRAKHYVAYAGLVPKTRATSDNYWNGHLCRQANMYLKRAYMEVAIVALKSRGLDIRMVHYYERIKRRKGIGVAQVALARKIAMVIYHMLKQEIDYDTCMARNRMAG